MKMGVGAFNASRLAFSVRRSVLEFIVDKIQGLS